MTAYKLFIQCSMPYITCKTIVNWKLETDYRWRLLQRTIWLLENCKSSLQSTTIYIYIYIHIYISNQSISTTIYPTKYIICHTIEITSWQSAILHFLLVLHVNTLCHRVLWNLSTKYSSLGLEKLSSNGGFNTHVYSLHAYF